VLLTKTTELALSYVLRSHSTPPAYTLSSSVTILAWLVFIVSLRKVFDAPKKIQKLMFVMSLLLLTSQSLEFYSIVKHTLYSHINVSSWPARYFCTFLYTALLFLFFVLCLVDLRYGPKYTLPDRSNRLRLKIMNEAGKLIEDDNSDELGGQRKEHKHIYLGVAEQTSNIFSSVFFWWVNNLVFKGYHKQLNNADELFELRENLSTSYLRKEMSEMLEEEKVKIYRGEGQEKRKSLLKILFEIHGRIFFGYLTVARFVMLVLEFSGPILLNLLVSFVEDSKVLRYLPF